MKKPILLLLAAALLTVSTAVTRADDDRPAVIRTMRTEDRERITFDGL